MDAEKESIRRHDLGKLRKLESKNKRTRVSEDVFDMYWTTTISYKNYGYEVRQVIAIAVLLRTKELILKS